jgi:uncharacterized protein with PQ loop repeat
MKEDLILALAIIGNTLNLAYNIPLVYQVIRNKNTRNISGSFLILRVVGSISWVLYGVVDEDIWIICANNVTLLSSLIIGGYKIRDRLKKNNNDNNDVVIYEV